MLREEHMTVLVFPQALAQEWEHSSPVTGSAASLYAVSLTRTHQTQGSGLKITLWASYCSTGREFSLHRLLQNARRHKWCRTEASFLQNAPLEKVYTKSSSLRKIVEDLYAANHCLLIMF